MQLYTHCSGRINLLTRTRLYTRTHTYSNTNTNSPLCLSPSLSLSPDAHIHIHTHTHAYTHKHAHPIMPITSGIPRACKNLGLYKTFLVFFRFLGLLVS